LSIARTALIACIACASLLCLCSSASAAIRRSGTLETLVTDNFRAGQSTTRYILRSGKQRIPVRPTELAAEPGDRVAVTGTMREDRLVGEVEATKVVRTSALVTPRKVAVLLISFPGDPAEPWSPEETRSNVFTGPKSARAFYQEESYGKISLAGKLNEAAGDVFGWISLESASTAACSYESWRNEANAKAATKGVDLSGYDDVVYVFPTRSVCSWLGIAAVNGNWAMINGDLGVHPIAHELGHNLGLEHAGSMTCFEGSQRVQISDSCAVNEYGDLFDVMGNIAPRHSSGGNLVKLGILGTDNIENAEQSGTYSIRSAFDETDEPTILRVPRTRSGAGVSSWYYLEIRKTGGLFENVTDASTTGVSIRIPQALGETALLDANPATSTFADAPLQEGQIFDAGSVQVTTLSAGGGEATVSVDLDEQAPTVPTNLVATPEFEGVKLQWGASIDNVGVDRYIVFRDGAEISSTDDTEFLDTRAPAGSHTYVVYAQDAFHNRSAASASATVFVSEFEGPACESGKCKVTFRYSGAPTTWSVPPGVSEAEFTVEGARGGGFGFNFGGRVDAPLAPLTTGEAVTVNVGGAGEPISDGGEGGYGGGGDGTFGAGGGGFSSVKLGSALMLLAAGGGGEGADGLNATTGQSLAGGSGSQGGEIGADGHNGVASTANGATLRGGKGGSRGGSFEGSGTDGAGGAGGEVSGSSSCVGGAITGAPGADGSAFSGGGGAPSAGGGGGGGYFGGGQGGGGASDACGNTAGWGGGGGGSSFAAPGVEAEFIGGARSGDGQVWISYPNPVIADDLSYLTEQNQELVVPAALGVLSGTPGPAGITLEVSEASPPSHGTVALTEDGGFTYVPASSFTGSDSFTYSLADPSGDSATGQIKLRVARPPSATITASPGGDTYTLEQVVSTSFSCSEGSGGTGLGSCNDSGGIETSKGGTGRLNTSTLGIHTYTVTSVSKTGLAGTESISYLVVAPQPPQISPPAPPSPPAKSQFLLALEGRSLRDVLQSGNLIVSVWANEGMSVTLVGKAAASSRLARASETRPIQVFKKKTVGFAKKETKKVTLVLTHKGRTQLARLRSVKLAITGRASGTAGAVAPQTVTSTLRR
jgi:Bacterial Ig domain/Gametolysin peptidase M11